MFEDSVFGHTSQIRDETIDTTKRDEIRPYETGQNEARQTTGQDVDWIHPGIRFDSVSKKRTRISSSNSATGDRQKRPVETSDETGKYEVFEDSLFGHSSEIKDSTRHNKTRQDKTPRDRIRHLRLK